MESSSQLINAGTFLTNTVSSGSGSVITVEDAGYFCDGYGLTEGDLIQLEGEVETARIIEVDYDNNIIIIDSTLVWIAGQGIGFPYSGTAPDMGAFEYDGTTSIEPGFDNNTSNIHLLSNYPNPFSQSTIIGYQLPAPCAVACMPGLMGLVSDKVILKVYNMLGQEIRTLANEKQFPGEYEVEFNAQGLPAGVYYYRLTIGKYSQTRKMILY